MNWEQFCMQWRAWIRPLLIILYCFFVLLVVPFLIVDSVKDGFTNKDQLILIGGLFVLTAIPVSVWHIIQHIIHFTKPILQKHIIRILWMVPIYALNAWLGLIFPEHSIYMDSLRECYEAYVIYNFMVYLLNYLNLEMDLEATLETKLPVKHLFPLCCMQPWQMGREFVHNCKHGILQYTVVRPITTLISVICELNGVYGEGNFSPSVAFPYIIAVNNVSQFIAMYCLVLFYQANKVELKPMRPIPKFLCIKAVVFFSFFQGVIINILVYFGYIKNIFGSTEDDDYKSLSSKLQNFLICIEMFLAAVAHHYSFPHDPFHINIPYYENNTSWYNAFVAMWDISDVQQDVSEHFGVVGSSLSRRLRGRSMYQMPRGNTESEYLIRPVPDRTYNPSGYQQYNSYNKISAQNGYGTIGINNAGTSSDRNNKRTIDIVQRNQVSDNYASNQGAPRPGNYLTSGHDSTASNSMSITITTPSRDDETKYKSGQESTAIKKSDSTASNWLSSPTEDLINIDVYGVRPDCIKYKEPNNT